MRWRVRAVTTSYSVPRHAKEVHDYVTRGTRAFVQALYDVYRNAGGRVIRGLVLGYTALDLSQAYLLGGCVVEESGNFVGVEGQVPPEARTYRKLILGSMRPEKMKGLWYWEATKWPGEWIVALQCNRDRGSVFKFHDPSTNAPGYDGGGPKLANTFKASRGVLHLPIEVPDHKHPIGFLSCLFALSSEQEALQEGRHEEYKKLASGDEQAAIERLVSHVSRSAVIIQLFGQMVVAQRLFTDPADFFRIREVLDSKLQEYLLHLCRNNDAAFPPSRVRKCVARWLDPELTDRLLYVEDYFDYEKGFVRELANALSLHREQQEGLTVWLQAQHQAARLEHEAEQTRSQLLHPLQVFLMSLYMASLLGMSDRIPLVAKKASEAIKPYWQATCSTSGGKQTITEWNANALCHGLLLSAVAHDVGKGLLQAPSHLWDMIFKGSRLSGSEATGLHPAALAESDIGLLAGILHDYHVLCKGDGLADADSMVVTGTHDLIESLHELLLVTSNTLGVAGKLWDNAVLRFAARGHHSALGSLAVLCAGCDWARSGQSAENQRERLQQVARVYVPAAHAALFHQREVYEMFSRHLSFGRYPLSALIAVADCIHAWGRFKGLELPRAQLGELVRNDEGSSSLPSITIHIHYLDQYGDDLREAMEKEAYKPLLDGWGLRPGLEIKWRDKKGILRSA